MKHCKSCGMTKPLTDFNKRGKGHQHACRECCSRRGKVRYQSPEIKSKIRVNAGRLRKAAADFVIGKLIASGGCVDCGENDLRVLEFDHVTGTKKMAVAQMRWNHSVESLAAEIAKCVVRCANCHRKKTAADQNWWSSRIKLPPPPVSLLT